MHYSELDKIKYIPIGESTDMSQKQTNWGIAFGLQEVDHLYPSKYMVSLAKDNIVGKKSYDQVEQEVHSYYEQQDPSDINSGEREADEVSIRIVKLLNDNSFTFSPLTLKQYHRALFHGIDLGISGKYIGEFRDVNISKKEPVLNGASVVYADFRMIMETLQYDFSEEAGQRYTKMSSQEQVERIATFASRIWQVHPFREGDTRTTAVFIQKYLNSKGFHVNNDMFKQYSLYFRNALVRANFSDIKSGVESEDTYLISFFQNLLLGTENTLDNDLLYIGSDPSEGEEEIELPGFEQSM